MTSQRSILIIGIDPDVIDHTPPDNLPPGATAEYVKGGLHIAQDAFKRRGDKLDLCMIRLDGTADDSIKAQLEQKSYDCVIIGGGIRLPPGQPSLVRNRGKCSAPFGTILRHRLQLEPARCSQGRRSLVTMMAGWLGPSARAPMIGMDQLGVGHLHPLAPKTWPFNAVQAYQAVAKGDPWPNTCW